MQYAEELEFETENRRDVYEYVEREGRVDPERAREALGFDRTAFGHHVAILRRDGLVTVDEDGQLCLAFHGGEAEEYTRGDVSFSVRPARQEDLSGLVGTIRQVVERGDYIVAETVADLLDREQALFRHGEAESWVFFVATVDEEVVGWVHVEHPELEKLAHTAELTLGVLEEHRARGIGSHLLERGIEWAASEGYEKLYNSVPATNEGAIAFLEEHGWAVEAVREGHYRIDGEDVDEVMLAREV
ncbi:MAG: GNAT family N-acetyltransferase [Halobacteriaceae archaeon]